MEKYILITLFNQNENWSFKTVLKTTEEVEATIVKFIDELYNLNDSYVEECEEYGFQDEIKVQLDNYREAHFKISHQIIEKDEFNVLEKYL